MKLGDLVLAYEALELLQKSHYDSTLAIKINRIRRELAIHVDPFQESIKKIQADFVKIKEEIFIKFGAEKGVDNNQIIFTFAEEGNKSLALLEINKKAEEIELDIQKIKDEDIKFELNSEKLESEDFENLKFKSDSSFDFSAIKFIDNFID